MENKLDCLKDILAGMESVLVAYSGGVDSTFLLKVASDVLGAKALAVIGDSSTLPSEEKQQALEIAEKLNVRYQVIESREISNPDFAMNSKDRCYWCKSELFSKLREIADREHIKFVVDGSNADDRSDYRPGTRAAREYGVRSPLQEAGLTKDEIRKFSRDMGLPTWDKPSMACLSSRIPYGEEITEDKLDKVEKAERILKSLGFKQVRVRHYNETARLEVAESDIPRLAEPDLRKKIVAGLKAVGYRYIALDLEGYRTGSMNP
ncbi:MAG: ATP-dependent sacrificial sulfur transferase LarE [Candidatus Latescibacter sp.]|nr:ATP-dependent sacrificial sulfur transferase LarE [Candidatus Latescibacter sp.]